MSAPPLPLTSTLAMIGNLAPRSFANFFTCASLPGSCPPNCTKNSLTDWPACCSLRKVVQTPCLCWENDETRYDALVRCASNDGS